MFNCHLKHPLEFYCIPNLKDTLFAIKIGTCLAYANKQFCWHFKLWHLAHRSADNFVLANFRERHQLSFLGKINKSTLEAKAEAVQQFSFSLQ